MSDLYREIMVKRKSSGMSAIVKVLLVLAAILGVLGGLVFWPIFIVGVAAILVFIFWAPKLDVEYEYLYVNGDLDIDAIYSKQKRKRVGEYHIEELEIAAPAGSHELDSYKNKKEIKIHDYTSKEENVRSYTMIFNKEKGQEMILVEIDEAIMKDLRRMAPRKVFLM